MSGTYSDVYRRHERYTQKDKVTRIRSYALELLREAMMAAEAASQAIKTGDPKKVWKATYEAVIASAPVNIRNMANILRNYKGSCPTSFEV